MASIPTVKKPLTVGKVDTYTYTVPLAWLAGESITSHTVTVDALVISNSSGVAANVIGVSLTGVTAGISTLHFDYTTSGGRSDCEEYLLKVTDEC